MEHTDFLPPSRNLKRIPHPVCRFSASISKIRYLNSFFARIIADLVNTVMTIVGVQLIDRVGRRRLLIIGALGMCISEFIVAIVGVTVGNINPVTQAVNLPAQKVLIAFVCMCVFFPFVFVILHAYFWFCVCLLIDI